MSATAHPRASTTTTDLALIATFAALIAVSSISAALPIGINGVPVTLQTFAVLLAGAILGPVRGLLAVSLYVIVGAAGLPIFAGGQAGLAPFAGPTAGYLLAFPIAALLIGLGARYAAGRKFMVLALCVGGLLAEAVMTLAGAGSIAIVSDLAYGTALKFALAYVPADLVKLLVAATVAAAVHRAFPNLLVRK